MSAGRARDRRGHLVGVPGIRRLPERTGLDATRGGGAQGGGRHPRHGDPPTARGAPARGREAQFRTLVEQLPAVTYIDTMEDPWRTTYVSPQIDSMLGYTRESGRRSGARGTTPSIRTTANGVLAVVEETNAMATPYDAEYRLVARDGRIVWVRDQARVVPVVGVDAPAGVMFDITSGSTPSNTFARRRSGSGLVEQSRRSSTSTSRIPRRRASASARASRIFGMSADEYIGDPDAWERRVHPDDVAEASAPGRRRSRPDVRGRSSTGSCAGTGASSGCATNPRSRG